MLPRSLRPAQVTPAETGGYSLTTPKPRNCCRSSSVRVTRYRFATIPTSPKVWDYGFRPPIASSMVEH